MCVGALSSLSSPHTHSYLRLMRCLLVMGRPRTARPHPAPPARPRAQVRDIEFERDLFVENDGLDDERRIVHFWELRFAAGGKEER